MESQACPLPRWMTRRTTPCPTYRSDAGGRGKVAFNFAHRAVPTSQFHVGRRFGNPYNDGQGKGRVCGNTGLSENPRQKLLFRVRRTWQPLETTSYGAAEVVPLPIGTSGLRKLFGAGNRISEMRLSWERSRVPGAWRSFGNAARQRDRA